MLSKLVALIGIECQNAIKHEIFGTQQFHIEHLERLPTADGVLRFRVTTWAELADEPRQTHDMELFELMQLIGSVVTTRAMGPAVLYLQSLPPATEAHVVELD